MHDRIANLHMTAHAQLIYYSRLTEFAHVIPLAVMLHETSGGEICCREEASPWGPQSDNPSQTTVVKVSASFVSR